MYEGELGALAIGLGVGLLVYAYEKTRNWVLKDVIEGLKAVNKSKPLQEGIKKYLGEEMTDVLIQAGADAEYEDEDEDEKKPEKKEAKKAKKVTEEKKEGKKEKTEEEE